MNKLRNMTTLEQLQEWVKGNSIHDEERNECCPDFSCCNSNMNTDIETRKIFLKAHIECDEKLKYSMLGGFLGEAISKHVPEKKVYISGNPVIED